MKNIFLIIPIFLFAMLLNGCSLHQETTEAEYHVISSSEAKEMMDKQSDLIILDVRTQEEFDSGHINNAILIPDTEISQRAESELTDKAATILVYCRSGRRSALASQELVQLGYTNVYDFGGIIDWPYEVVTK